MSLNLFREEYELAKDKGNLKTWEDFLSFYNRVKELSPPTDEFDQLFEMAVFLRPAGLTQTPEAVAAYISTCLTLNRPTSCPPVSQFTPEMVEMFRRLEREIELSEPWVLRGTRSGGFVIRPRRGLSKPGVPRGTPIRHEPGEPYSCWELTARRGGEALIVKEYYRSNMIRQKEALERLGYTVSVRQC